MTIYSRRIFRAPLTPVVPGWFRNRVLAADDSETVEAQRRRRGSGEGPSGRADMSGRPSSSGGGGGGGGRPSSGGGGLPGGKGCLSTGVIVLLVAVYLLFSLFSGGDEGSTGDETTSSQGQVATEEQVPPAGAPAAATRAPTKPRPTASGPRSPQTWTVLLYEDADDPVLERDMLMDLNEAERVGSTDQINIVAQMDRYAGAYRGDGDWRSTRRYRLTQDADLFRLNSEMVADLGELSMADPATLVDFATWAIQTYPADKYVLILSDHGMGWPGGLTDPKPSERREVDTPFADDMEDNMMYTGEIDQALAKIRQQTGIDRFELVGLDACLMSHLEVYSALAPHARYVVSSQETEPALGWAYAGFLQALIDNPGIDGAELGRQIVATYIDKDERIVDEQARLDFLRQDSPLGGAMGNPANVKPAQISRQISKSITLNAADMDALPGLMDSVNRLAFALQKEDQKGVARARKYAQSFSSIFGDNVQPSYIDLGSFAGLLQKESSSAAVRSAAGEVLEQIQRTVVAEKHGSEKPGATGVSIYFPNRNLYGEETSGAGTYTGIVDRFAADSLWDDFLAFHYTHTPFKLDANQAVIPAADARMVAPGEGQITISRVKLSATTVDYDQPVSMEATLKGNNIGYVYLFVGYYDPNGKSILIADQDYLESPETRQIGDLYYPVWSDGKSFKLKYTWTPSVFAIDDGSRQVVALFTPERYGASTAEAVYTVDGIYTEAASGEKRYARMYFSDGKLTRIFGFTGMKPTGAMHELMPQSGDQFTLIQTWLEPDGDGGYRRVTENGETLTFSAQPLVWKELYAAAGDYLIGFVASDLEGNQTQSIAKIRIK